MLPAAVAYKFSPQQITGINHYYSKIVNGIFEEDDVRLLLIHLREFLRNRDNRGAIGRENALFLREAGDSVAHTIRHQGLLHDRLLQHLPGLATGAGGELVRVPHPLFDLNKLVGALSDALEDSGVLYAPGNLRDVIARESLDIKICLISLLNGMVLQFEYPTIRDDFVFFSPEAKPIVYIRTEADAGGIDELRLNAALPYTGGKFNACVVLCVIEDRSKIEQAVRNRTGSADGYCEPIRAFRRDGVLRLGVVPTGVSSIHLHNIRRAMAYDTNPFPKNAGLVLPPGFEAWVKGGPEPPLPI